MSTSFRFDDPTHLVPGTVGPPGQRVFYLQVVEGNRVVSLRCEKGQVAALAQHLANMLADLPTTEPDQPPALTEPPVTEWVVGSLGMAYDETVDRVVVVAEELIAGAEQDEGEGDEEAQSLADIATARVSLTRAQAAGFVDAARDLLRQGRPSCPICGGPMDPEGHVCPRSNGHRPLSS